MRRDRIVFTMAIVIVIVILFSSFGILKTDRQNSIEIKNDKSYSVKINYNVLNKSLLIRFYESQFIKEAGLLRAAVTAPSENISIYISNDNFLAVRALRVLGLYNLSSIINRTLKEIYPGYINCRLGVLFGKPMPSKIYGTNIITFGQVYSKKFRACFIIKTDMCNRSKIMYDWFNYSDLVVYRALNYTLSCNLRKAMNLFMRLIDMWDGYGFKDNVYNNTGLYQVYKCALFIYLYRTLKAAGLNSIDKYDNIVEKCLNIIRGAQDNATGGIHTDYKVINGKVVFPSDVNVETTSFVVLALYSKYPINLGEMCR